MKRKKIYLAGPDVFLPNAVEIGKTKKKMTHEGESPRESSRFP